MLLKKKCYFASQLFIFNQFKGSCEEIGFSRLWGDPSGPQDHRATSSCHCHSQFQAAGTTPKWLFPFGVSDFFTLTL